MGPLAIVELLLPIVETIGAKITAAIAAAKQSGELTAAKEAAYRARQANIFGQDYAKVRPLPPKPAPAEESSEDSEDSSQGTGN